MVTADTLTEEQIRAAFARGDISVDDAHEALNETVWPKEREAARRRIADKINTKPGRTGHCGRCGNRGTHRENGCEFCSTCGAEVLGW